MCCILNSLPIYLTVDISLSGIYKTCQWTTAAHVKGSTQKVSYCGCWECHCCCFWQRGRRKINNSRYMYIFKFVEAKNLDGQAPVHLFCLKDTCDDSIEEVNFLRRLIDRVEPLCSRNFAEINVIVCLLLEWNHFSVSLSLNRHLLSTG